MLVMSTASRHQYDFSDRQCKWYESMVRIFDGREFQVAGPHAVKAFLSRAELITYITRLS